MSVGGGYTKFLVLLREGLKEFLSSLGPYFRFSVSTLATLDYAKEILRLIDVNN